MRIIKRTFFYLTAMLLTLLLFTVVINTAPFDQALLPEVQAIRDQKSEPFQENNAYLAMWAFGHGLDQPFTQTVEALRQQLNDKIRSQGVDYLSHEENERFRAPKGLDEVWRDRYIRCNSREQVTCMQQMIEQLSGQTITDQRLLALLQRYKKLWDYPDYQEAVLFNWEAPSMAYGPIMDIKRIYLAQAYHELTGAAFIEISIRDQEWWRNVLQNGRYLITYMIAVSSIRDNLYALSEGVRNQRFNHSELLKLQQQLLPLSKQELDISETFNFEFKYGMSMVDQIDREEDIGLSRWVDFYQPNATHNMNYQYVTKPLINLAQLSSQNLYQKIKTDHFELQPVFDWSPSMLYNPVGKTLSNYSPNLYQNYLARIHDLNGMVLLLKLQLELALNPKLDPQQVVNESVHRNPYTGEAMIYDAAAKRLFFECFDPHSVCEINL